MTSVLVLNRLVLSWSRVLGLTEISKHSIPMLSREEDFKPPAAADESADPPALLHSHKP